jgi:hypothetical protein
MRDDKRFAPPFLLQTGRPGGAEFVSVRRRPGISMTDWKADLNALVEETGWLTNSVQAKAPSPPAQREEIEQRVAKFKAHQQRLIRARGDFAASEWKRMLASQPAACDEPAKTFHSPGFTRPE